MKISYLRIRNFKSIRDLEINELENALILVGKNNTGKTNVIDAILTATGNHIPKTTESDNLSELPYKERKHP